MATDFLSALGGGSGLNITELTENLVAAERAPYQSIIDRSKEKADVTISAYGVVKSAVETLKGSFAELDDVSDLISYSINSSNTASVTATANSDASVGSYDLQVTALSARDTWVFDGVDSLTAELGSDPMSVNVSDADGAATALALSDRSLTGIAAAINESNIGLTATIIDTQSSVGRYRLSVNGDTGSENSFAVSIDGLSSPTQTSTASDLSFTFNGIEVTRSSNVVSDLLDGVTLDFKALGSSAIEISNDTSELKQKLQNMASAFNGVQTVFNTLKTGDDADDELAGSLATDSSFRSIVSQIRSTLTAQISTASGDINYLTDLGIGFTREGFLEVDEAQLDSALADDLDDIVTALSADTEQQTVYGTASRGLAGDMFVMLDLFTRSTGVITTTINNAASRQLDYEKDLADLDSRMERIKSAYLTQFSAMEQIIGRMKSTGEFLTNQLAISTKD